MSNSIPRHLLVNVQDASVFGIAVEPDAAIGVSLEGRKVWRVPGESLDALAERACAQHWHRSGVPVLFLLHDMEA